MSEQHEHTEELRRIRDEAMSLLRQTAELASALTAAIDRQITQAEEDKKKRRHLYVVRGIVVIGAGLATAALALARFALRRPLLAALATVAAVTAVAAAVILPHQNTAAPSLPQAVPSRGAKAPAPAAHTRVPSPALSPVAKRTTPKPAPAPVVVAFSRSATASPAPASSASTPAPSPSPSTATPNPSPSPSPTQSCLVKLLNLVCVNLGLNIAR